MSEPNGKISSSGVLRGVMSGGGGGTSNYDALENKPQINGVELVGDKSLDDLGIDIPTKTSELDNDSGFVTSEDIPTKTSELDNDSGFITGDNYYDKSEIDTALSGKADKSDTYTKSQVDTALSAKASTTAILPTCFDFIPLINTATTRNYKDVTYTFPTRNTCTLTGTASDLSFCNLYMNLSALPNGMKQGSTLQVNVSGFVSGIRLGFFFYKNGSQYGNNYYITESGTLKVPSDTDGLVIRIDVVSGTQTNVTIGFNILNGLDSQKVTSIIEQYETLGYLSSTNDSTVRTNEFVSILTNKKVLRLGVGDFYIQNVDMPEGTSIIGSGYGTRIIRSGTVDGYAFKMGNYCSIENCQIIGALSPITLSSTVGGRHGILWKGNYTQDQTPANQPQLSKISNVWIRNFNGGGITCDDTGSGTFNHLEVVNVDIRRCNAGINIAYRSEYNKFTNVRTQDCYYGCINNGGNNVFTNCDFSSCKLGFLIDNSDSQSPNNSHGSCIGCIFNHTDSNSGIGIKLLNCTYGFIFTGCQVFFSQIQIEDSNGIVFGGCNFGSSNCNITISGGKTILFANNMHQTAPTITITNNTDVHFDNCYNANTGEAISA